MRKHLWLVFAAVIPVGLLIALGWGPRSWKPFLSPEVSTGIVLLGCCWFLWQTFRQRKHPPA